MKPRHISWVREGDCIVSTGHSLNSDGYPQFCRNGKRRLIGRVVLFRRYGPQPSSICMRHTCDNRRCINPNHIIPGSFGDNNRDREARGRGNPPRGERCAASKLTEKQVREIQKLSRDGIILQREIAELFGLYQGTVSRITNGLRWKHIK
jgi:hypothetical protein